MSTQAAPVMPPRPSRSPHPHGLAAASSDLPKIPPRPVNRRPDRSVSPIRDSYAPSPLNELPNGSSVSRTASNEASHLPHRPPSVTIPSLGEEGIEYADLDYQNSSSDTHTQTPAEMRSVSSDLKLHAPKPSLPTSSAKAKVQAVTRTDSHQAAAAGFGKAVSPSHEESERRSRSLHSKTPSRAGSTASSDRRRSGHFGNEQGIPEIGQRVPMYPNAGDVQAPSPSPFLSANGSERPGRHQRTRSGREASLPPGSYGLHGHGVHSNDRFEKEWYEKHPDELAREEGQYGSGIGNLRPDWALSSEDLNKLVRNYAAKASVLGTSPGVTGTPEEELAYVASDEYISRLNSPAPGAHRDTQPAVESPLRKTTSQDSQGEAQDDAGKRKSVHSTNGEGTGVIHVDDPYHPLHHPDGYCQTPAPEDRSRTPGEGDPEYDEPILAADEVRPDSAFLHPAISPTFERRASPAPDPANRSRTPSAAHSRASSRPTSLHGAVPNLAKYNSRGEEVDDTHTPLEDVEEYEPLFPDDDAADNKPISAADRFKQRPEFAKHRFPSEDLWEDTPNSLQLQATVTTPDLPKQDSARLFETPEQEEARRKQTDQIDSHKVASHTLEGSHHGGAPSRPDTVKQRFPSQDIWEDAPDSQQLVTTIEPSEEAEAKSPPPPPPPPPEIPSKPVIPPRPQKKTPPAVDPSTKPALSAKDPSPEKTSSPTEEKKAPAIPDRPKPQIPARPSKPLSRGLSDNSSSKAPSAGATGGSETSREATEPPAPKPKPTVPARPVGKIAALRAGFLSDLNARLQQGPPKPQEKEENEAPAEKVPLSDARKGRARGPARRKPGTSAVTSTAETKLPTIPEIRITEVWSVWQVGEDGRLVVGEEKKIDKAEPTPTAPDASESAEGTIAPIAQNVAGESADQKSVSEPQQDAPAAEDAMESKPSPAPESVARDATSSPSAIAEATPSTSSTEDQVQTEAEPAVEPSTERDESGAASPVAAETAAETKSSTPSSTEEAAEKDLETVAGSADDKKASDGTVDADA